MAVVIHGGAAGIHSNGVIGGWSEFLHLARERVVESKRQTEIVAKRSIKLSEGSVPFAAEPREL
jgi:hypothetical protein